MATIAYHASHEQFAPSHLVRLAVQAQHAGFTAIHSSDHFHPWSQRQGHSGFSFSWLGAAMQATSLPFSVICAPGQRYHPAIVAQATATLCEMFPGRFSLEIGSGEALNEKITGENWPVKQVRNERLLECNQVIKKLLKGEEVNHVGNIHVQEARLYTLPEKMPQIFCAALSEETCKWGATWADGLLTTAGELEEVKNKIRAFKENGGAGKPVFLQYSFSYARNENDALESAYEQWRSNLVPATLLNDLWKPEQFDDATEKVTREHLKDSLDISSDIHFFKQKIEGFLGLGIDRLILHNVNTMQEDFIEAFGPFIK